MKRAVLLLKVEKADLASINALLLQIVQLVRFYQNNGLQIVDGAVILGGPKEARRALKKIDAVKWFDFVLLYSPAQIAQSRGEFLEFKESIEQDFKCALRWYRTG